MSKQNMVLICSDQLELNVYQRTMFDINLSSTFAARNFIIPGYKKTKHFDISFKILENDSIIDLSSLNRD